MDIPEQVIKPDGASSSTVFIPEHFGAFEFVDPKTYAEKGEAASLALIRVGLLVAIETIRVARGYPITVNNWHKHVKKWVDSRPVISEEELGRLTDDAWCSANGVFRFRGLRPAWDKGGAILSRHRPQSDGKNDAVDFEEVGMEDAAGVQNCRDWIQTNKAISGLAWVMRMENRAGWVHLDGAVGHGPRIHLFDP